MRRLLLGLLLVSAPFVAQAATNDDARVILLVRQGRVADAVDMYHQHTTSLGHPDFELLQQLGLALLEEGCNSEEPEQQLLAIYGAGIAAHDGATGLLAAGLASNKPETQLIALDLLAKVGNDEADALIARAATSDQLLIRLTALHHLIQKKHPCSLGQVEALYHKVVPELHPLFPQFFALTGEPRAIRQLRRLLHDPGEEVRIQTILSIGEHGRDELLPQIRTLMTHSNPREQEACASVVGRLGDQASIPRLKVLLDSKIPDVQLAAALALYQLGVREEAQQTVEKLARTGNLFAVALLGKIEGTEPLLIALVQTNHLSVKCNATLALLQRRDPHCIAGLADLFLRDNRDLAFTQVQSRGSSLTAWKAVQSASHVLHETPVAFELSTSMREQALAASLELPNDVFYQIADSILDQKQNDLVPQLVELLENTSTPKAIALLSKYQQKVGAPLVRNYCTLALVKLGEPGPYAEKLRQWLLDQKQTEMIQFRPFVPMELRENHHSLGLTPQETSRLYIAAVETFANRRDEEGLDVLLELIRDGNPRNRYALAGLLVRAAQ